MSIRENSSQLTIQLEKILKDSQYDMQQQAYSIMLEIESNVEAAKKDVRDHITHLLTN